ncbi:MAG TPA: VWA domain-containing protein, partial [Tissierellaceae bacterium]
NLLSNQIKNILMEVNSSKENIIEREGISAKHESEFILIGSMNPEEGILNSQFIDKFGLFVNVKGETNLRKRQLIVKRRLDYEKNNKAFYKQFKEKEDKLKEKIILARKRLSKVKVSDELYTLIAEIIKESNCQGHRGDIILLETSKALAAFDDREFVSYEDIKMASKYVLVHRMREQVEIDEHINDQSDLSEEKDKEKNKDKENDNNLDKENNFNPDNLKDFSEEIIEDIKEDIKEDIEEIQEDLEIKMKDSHALKDMGTGKRLKVKTDTNKGRYIRYKTLNNKDIEDIAFDATLKVAAINQKNREKTDMALNIRKSDLRNKIRESKTGASIIFLVDASGSMGARKRMGAVKGAALSLLNDAYQKRDNVSIIAFRDKKAEVILQSTRSVDLAKKSLEDIKTGGLTPLALGLDKAYIYAKAEKRRKDNPRVYLVILSDGKANVALKTDDPLKDAYDISKKIKSDNIKSLVLDTESGFMNYGYAKELSKALDGDYIKLSKVSKEEIKSNVVDLINKNI